MGHGVYGAAMVERVTEMAGTDGGKLPRASRPPPPPLLQSEVYLRCTEFDFSLVVSCLSLRPRSGVGSSFMLGFWHNHNRSQSHAATQQQHKIDTDTRPQPRHPTNNTKTYSTRVH